MGMKWVLAGMALFSLGGGISFTWSQRQQANLLKLSQTCASEAERFLHQPGSVWSGPLANPIYATHYSRAKQACLLRLDRQAQIAPLQTDVDRSEIINPVHQKSLLLFVRAETDFVVARTVEYQLQREDETEENGHSEIEGQPLEKEFHARSRALMTE
jgi:hypothetical protein